jgi:hypothetical protein
MRLNGNAGGAWFPAMVARSALVSVHGALAPVTRCSRYPRSVGTAQIHPLDCLASYAGDLLR